MPNTTTPIAKVAATGLKSKQAKRKLSDLPVHPLADAFPMLSVDNLQLLADDIKANGLQSPVLVANGKLIDGRNRLKACRIAGVPARWNDLGVKTEVEIRDLIASLNLHRRSLSIRNEQPLQTYSIANQRGPLHANKLPTSSA